MYLGLHLARSAGYLGRCPRRTTYMDAHRVGHAESTGRIGIAYIGQYKPIAIQLPTLPRHLTLNTQ